jgi:hypothetical protein
MKFLVLYGTVSSLLYLQKNPDKGPYPKPDECSPSHPPYYLKNHFSIILQYSLLLGHASGLIHSDFPNKTVYAFLNAPCVLNPLQTTKRK